MPPYILAQVSFITHTQTHKQHNTNGLSALSTGGRDRAQWSLSVKSYNKAPMTRSRPRPYCSIAHREGRDLKSRPWSNICQLPGSGVTPPVCSGTVDDLAWYRCSCAPLTDLDMAGLFFNFRAEAKRPAAVQVSSRCAVIPHVLVILPMLWI